MSNVDLHSQKGRFQVDDDNGPRQSTIQKRRIQETPNPEKANLDQAVVIGCKSPAWDLRDPTLGVRTVDE